MLPATSVRKNPRRVQSIEVAALFARTSLNAIPASSHRERP